MDAEKPTDPAAQPSSDGTQNTGATGVGTPPGDATPQAAPTPTPAPATITLTQAQLDKMFDTRLAQDRKAREEAAQKKAQEEAGNFRVLYETLQAESAAALAAAQEEIKAARLENAVLRHAAAAHIRADAQGDALKLLDPTLVEWDAATHRPQDASVKAALAALVKDRPYLVATPDPAAPAPGPSSFAPRGTGTNGKPAESAAQNRVSGQW